MSRRGASVLAWSLWGLFVGLLVSTTTLAVMNGTPIVAADLTNSLAFLALAEKKRIGCFCAPGARCHRDIIVRVLAAELAK